MSEKLNLIIWGGRLLNKGSAVAELKIPPVQDLLLKKMAAEREASAEGLSLPYRTKLEESAMAAIIG